MSIFIVNNSIYLICCDIDQFYIKYLRIFGNYVTNKSIPREIKNMTNIIRLLLPYFGSINIELDNLRNLKLIDLCNNNLTKLPNILLKKSKISHALLHSNNITNVDGISNKLKSLLLTNNLIEYPPKIKKMKEIYNNKGIYTSYTKQDDIDYVVKNFRLIINYKI